MSGLRAPQGWPSARGSGHGPEGHISINLEGGSGVGRARWRVLFASKTNAVVHL